MDLQAVINAMNAVGDATRSNYHLTLGNLIAALKVAADKPVRFDSGGSPKSADSYRGYYSDLAFDTCEDEVSASALLKEAEAALGNTFTGYKGGDYTMTEKTPLWQAEYGCCGNAIVGFSDRPDALVLLTKQIGD